jgi:predicted Rossmann fold flavoprotein
VPFLPAVSTAGTRRRVGQEPGGPGANGAAMSAASEQDVLVVGGGAAGMIAAWRAAQCGARVLLLEKNDRLGIKLHISGGGKCNITHHGEIEAVRAAFSPEEGRFLRHAFGQFTNDDVLALLHARGVETYVRPDGRIFPVSGRAEDVVDALEWHMRSAGASVRRRAAVTEICAHAGRACGVRLDVAAAPTRGRPDVGHEAPSLRARAVILATGGSSYPKTGTTGDGFGWARSLGHTLVPLRAALAPLYLRDPPPSDWSGVALRDSLLRARNGDRKVIARWRGDTLFTHHGLSGPTALGVSAAVAVGMESGPVTVDVDLLPDETPESLAAALTAPEHRSARRGVRSLLDAWLPNRIVPLLLAQAGIDLATPLHQLRRPERNRLIELLKRLDLGPVRHVPLERGEVTAGGVALAEVDPTTMASRKVAGLYLCGELLDIDGPIGGYNLQAAFSTGFVAGEAAAAWAQGGRR